MPNRSTDELFQLVKTLDKGEKRNFKLYVGRNAASEDLKIITLFDAIDRSDAYDEDLIIKKNPTLQKQQLSNLKAHLYRQILASLRLIRNEQSVDLMLHEQLDYARILYNKGLYHQSLKSLHKIKEQAKYYNQITFWVQALFLEKKIETLHITRSFDDRAEVLSAEVELLNDRLLMVGKLSNLALQLYGWYIKNGHVRDQKDEEAVMDFFQKHMPPHAIDYDGFYERMYYHQSYAWYGFILQDLLSYYRHCQRWVDQFEKEPHMIRAEPQQYIKGMHNLLSAHFMLRNDRKFMEGLQRFEEFYASKEGSATINNQAQGFVYLSLARINLHYLQGTFTEGLELIPEIEAGLKKYEWQLDLHRTMVFYYKFACLYFGCGEFEQAIDYLNRIIQWKGNLRSDLQCYARLLHMIAHYELGNDMILESLVRSVYRYMSNMKNLSTVEHEIFSFIRHSFAMSRPQMQEGFVRLFEKLKKLEGNPLESRSFMYLDILSWLESKINRQPVQDVIARQFKSRILPEKAG